MRLTSSRIVDVLVRTIPGIFGTVGKGDIRAQTRQCLGHIQGVLEATGGSLRDLVKVTVFLRDLKHYDGMNEVRREMLAGIPFASSTVQAILNNPDALVEIEAVAVVGG